MLDERTRRILQAPHDQHGDAWLEGLLTALEALRIELHQATSECEALAGNDPAALDALLKQAWEGELKEIAADYNALRAYTLALLEAGVEYSLGMAQIAEQLARVMQGGAYVSA
jgi:hypothetical protein